MYNDARTMAMDIDAQESLLQDPSLEFPSSSSSKYRASTEYYIETASIRFWTASDRITTH